MIFCPYLTALADKHLRAVDGYFAENRPVLNRVFRLDRQRCAALRARLGCDDNNLGLCADQSALRLEYETSAFR